jgi:hypothetical protein
VKTPPCVPSALRAFYKAFPERTALGTEDRLTSDGFISGQVMLMQDLVASEVRNSIPSQMRTNSIEKSLRQIEPDIFVSSLKYLKTEGLISDDVFSALSRKALEISAIDLRRPR